MANIKSYTPNHATPPGWTLEELLEEKSMTQADLARRAELSPKLISQIIHGEAPISAETAIKLEPATGVPARIWQSLESSFREHEIRLMEEQELDNHKSFLNRFPTAAMVRMGILTPRAKPAERLREIFNFFGVASPAAWEAIWSNTLTTAEFRKSPESNSGALAVWLRLGELKAPKIREYHWDAARFRYVLRDALELTQNPDPGKWYPKLLDSCAKAGVSLVVIPEVSGAKVNGASRWLAPNHALIQLSLRHRWSDIFWFSFFHEARHILDEKKTPIFVNYLANNRDESEMRADSFAANFLIPQQYSKELNSLKSLSDVKAFASKIDIHPGIVVGRLQHEGLWDHSKGNGLRQRLEFTESAQR